MSEEQQQQVPMVNGIEVEKLGPEAKKLYDKAMKIREDLAKLQEQGRELEFKATKKHGALEFVYEQLQVIIDKYNKDSDS